MTPALRLRLSAIAALLSLALSTAFAQQPAAADMGRIHGRVINPTGMPQKDGTVSLSTDGGVTLRFNFPVSAIGEYSGQAPQGEYTVVYRAPETPEGKIVDFIREVEVLAGQDTAQDIDMTRQEFIDRLTPEQQMQLQAIREANAAAPAVNKVTAAISSDFQTVNQDLHDVQNARATATQNLGATATKAEIEASTTEIENTKYSEIETLMTKDTAAIPGEPALWIDLAQAELGLKNFVDAEINYKKALDLESKTGSPRPVVLGAIDAGLGEVYARTLMVDEANAAFDAAAKADPDQAAMYLRNQAIIFFHEKNTNAQVDAADEAIHAAPNDAILYYIKAQGLAANAPFDPDTNKMVLPPGCAAALRKYLELAPNGPFAADVSTLLQHAK